MKKKRALVAEDNDEHYKAFKGFLAEMGLEVEREAFGNAALERMLNRDYDIVILDVELPEKDGREILREVRKSKPYLPIIFISRIVHYTTLLFTSQSQSHSQRKESRRG